MFVVEQLPSCTVIGAEGDIDMVNSDEFGRVVLLAAETAELVAVDLTLCSYMGSNALSVLVRASKRLDDRLGLVVPESCPVRKIFRLTSLDRHFALFETRAACLAALEKAS